MIRIKLPPNETLEALVDRHVPAKGKRKSWRDRARAHTAKLKANRKYSSQGAPDWGEIKALYVVLQSTKCAYCEKYLEGSEQQANDNVGAVEQDVEHFRPKSSVKSWQPSVPLGFTIRNGTAFGYYMLAFDLWNYCVACKTCNSRYKSNCFPIEGKPAKKGAHKIAAVNTSELPLLLYPLSDIDCDPEMCIGFNGYRPVAKQATGREKRRALTTIRFFDLDVRENLLRQRSEVIVSMYRALRDSVMANDLQVKAAGERDVTRLLSDQSQHTNCARSYRDIFIANPETAHEYYLEAQQLLTPK